MSAAVLPLSVVMSPGGTAWKSTLLLLPVVVLKVRLSNPSGTVGMLTSPETPLPGMAGVRPLAFRPTQTQPSHSPNSLLSR